LRILLVLVLVGALAGCGTYRWEKRGGPGDFQGESEECRQQVGAAGQDPGLAWENCMMGRGWRYRTGWF
jgi:hypothetical protein